MKTNLFIIGGQRCGTTWLCNQLDLCPSVNLLKPVAPETKYFLNDEVSHKEYMNLFDNSSGNIFLEKATTYIERPDAALKIKSLYPARAHQIELEAFAAAETYTAGELITYIRNWCTY